MSVAHVVFRLEVADENTLPKTLDFQASQYKMAHGTSDVPRLSYSAVTSGVRDKTQIETELHRGHREIHDITVETVYNENLKTDDDGASEQDTSPGSITEIETIDISKRKSPSFNDRESSPLTSHIRSNVSDSVFTSRTASRETSFSPIGSRESSCTSEGGSGPGTGTIWPVSHSPTGRSSSSLHFYSGNPMVEVTRGILHLFKENQMTSLSDDVSRSEMICILGVPGAYTIHDLLKFTAPVHLETEYMRIVRDTTPNQYMVLMKFTSQKYADEFYSTYNNTPFNSIEPDICHLVYVARVECIKSSEGAGLPIPGLTELPNCPVCLERMDESVDGVLTILCNHAFHMSCLSKWGDTSCPVCRYCQIPEEVADNKCAECGSQESLWMCLICGVVGCGRYSGMHAYKHFQETQHTFAMQLGNNKVWDYVGDNYVHRLVQNKGDGKLVEVDERGRVVQEEKMDSLALEYTYLLTSQLDSQRLYFEEKMALVESQAHSQMQEIEARCKQTHEKCEEFEKKVSTLVKDKQSAEKKCSNLHARLTKVLNELQDEQELNKGLQANQQVWQQKTGTLESTIADVTSAKEKEVRDLQEQLRDVMFHFEASQELSSTTVASQDDIQGGQVIVGASAAPSSSKRGRKKPR